MSKQILAVAALLLLSTSSLASEVSVKGRAYSTTHCAYGSTSMADFVVSYRNDRLPWGTRVRLKYGFKSGFTQKIWERQGETSTEASAPYTWRANLKEVTIDSRGSYASSDLQFVFEIIWPNGRTTWDNGGASDLGYYQAAIPRRTCEVENLVSLPVVTR